MELRIDPAAIGEARRLARAITAPIGAFIDAHSTVAVERSVLRLLGVDGVGRDDIPVPNLVLERLGARVRSGVARALGALVAETGRTPDDVASAVAAGSLDVALGDATPEAAARAALERYVRGALVRIDVARSERERRLERMPQLRAPLLYVIVASGNIYEDRTAAIAAAEAGAQIIAVIRSTGQSLLDFVPFGATTEGFGGTYATQENFRIMREALDAVSERLGRHVMLTNYASGLCMPEIATMAALERLDMLLNDSMYGILFRDINMKRTFVDQHFSRLLNARAGIVINTGEDNYLTTADAVEQAPAVLASQFINEAFAHRAGMADDRIGLGDAYEIDPALEDGFLFAVAQAQLARQCFPDAPLKYMPPTKFMTGNVFAGYLHDGFFNLASMLTGQSIILVGMMTEGIVTPFLSDRDLALENVRYVRSTAGGLAQDFVPAPGGLVVERAHTVLLEAVALLERIVADTLLDAIADGTFGITKRPADGGRGLSGVVAKSDAYWNPASQLLEA